MGEEDARGCSSESDGSSDSAPWKGEVAFSHSWGSGSGDLAFEGGYRGARGREPSDQKGALALASGSHKSSEERALLVASVDQAKSCGVSVKRATQELGLSRSSYYRYRKAAAPKVRSPRRKVAKLLPSERKAVRDTALLHPLTGYKRLTFLLQNEGIAGVRAHQVRTLLKEEGLLGSRAPLSCLTLKRPKAPERPNQIWHIDLMYVRVERTWYYLVDILDAYSRYLVHWTLNPTMLSHTVTLTVQGALEKWKPSEPPGIVHDSGTQFLSREWRDFASHHGMPSIRTRIAHPESNGLLERLHRTHRREALAETEDWSLERAKSEMADWTDVYNRRRPHLALQGLPPIVYYLGEPEAALAQREHFVENAARARKAYWSQVNTQSVSR